MAKQIMPNGSPAEYREMKASLTATAPQETRPLVATFLEKWGVKKAAHGHHKALEILEGIAQWYDYEMDKSNAALKLVISSGVKGYHLYMAYNKAGQDIERLLEYLETNADFRVCHGGFLRLKT